MSLPSDLVVHQSNVKVASPYSSPQNTCIPNISRLPILDCRVVSELKGKTGVPTFLGSIGAVGAVGAVACLSLAPSAPAAPALHPDINKFSQDRPSFYSTLRLQSSSRIQRFPLCL